MTDHGYFFYLQMQHYILEVLNFTILQKVYIYVYVISLVIYYVSNKPIFTFD